MCVNNCFYPCILRESFFSRLRHSSAPEGNLALPLIGHSPSAAP
jgi:hypothetical protein